MLTANRVQRLLESLHSPHWDSLLPWPSVTAQSAGQPRIWAGDSGVLIELSLPGRQLSDFEITAEKNRLRVEARSSQPEPAPESYRLHERSAGVETAEFRLQFPVREELTDIRYQDGVLRIQISRPEEEQPRKLSVRAG